MADNYQRGDLLPVRFTPITYPGLSAGVAVVLDVRGWNFDDMALLHDCTTTRHQGRRARFAGLGDSAGNVTAFFDLDKPPYATPPTIKAGILALIEPFVATDLSDQFSIGIAVEKVHWQSSCEEFLAWNFDWKESVLAGKFSYPKGATPASGANPAGQPQGNP